MAKKKANVGKFTGPPFLSYDPSIEAQRQAARRGLGDTKKDIRIAKKAGRQDFRQALRDLSTKSSRSGEDLATSLTRGQEKLGFQRQDTLTRQARGQADFATRLAGVTRQFTNLGRTQTEGAQAAGVSEGGTAAASQQKRAENFALARQPIDTGLQRLNEDTATRLGRLDTAGQQLGQDVAQKQGRIGQDVARDRRLATLEQHRGNVDFHIKKQRAIREQKIADLDLLAEETYQARSQRPGAFGALAKSLKPPGVPAARRPRRRF